LNKKKYLIPALVAVFVLGFALAAPFVMASSGYDKHGEYNKSHWAVPVEGFVGSIQITEDVDKHALMDQVTVSLSEASKGLDVKKASLGIAVNENDDKFLVWKLVDFNMDAESDTITATIYIVDAGDVENTTSVTKEFDHSMKDGKYDHSGA